jgi:hypothetical protein
MGVKTPWAFVAETGQEWVTAYDVWQYRQRYGGRSIGKTFFSPHALGQRKPMRHVDRGTPHFAYNSSADEHAAGAGESLSHRLFKETIARLTATRLVLDGGRGEEVITIVEGETEREIVHGATSFFADAYLRFTSAGRLGVKWSGEMYVEIHHTHAVPPDKIDALRALRLPVVEIKIPEFAEYREPEESATEELMEWHRQRLKRIFEGPKGFLMAKVLNDPSSAEYLESQLRETNLKVREVRAAAANASLHLDAALDRERDLTSRLNALTASNDILHRQVERLTTKLRETEAANRNLADNLQEKSELLDATSQERKTWKLGSVLIFAAVMAIGLLKIVLAIKSRLS